MAARRRVLKSCESCAFNLSQTICGCAAVPILRAVLNSTFLCTCRYVVLNRPYAFVQWLRSAVYPERYVFMSEPDHLWLRPMPNLMVGQRPAAFPFFYIEPAKKDFKHITEKFTGPLSLREAESIVPMGEPPAY